MHKIEAALFQVRGKLEAEGLSEDQMQAKLKEARKLIEEKLSSDTGDKKESHMAALAKEQQMEKVKSALRIRGEYKPGSAFDFETQQKKQVEETAQREELRKKRKAERKLRDETPAVAAGDEKKAIKDVAAAAAQTERKSDGKEEGELAPHKRDEGKKTPVAAGEAKKEEVGKEKHHGHHKHHRHHKKRSSSRSRSASKSRSGSGSRNRSRSKEKSREVKKDPSSVPSKH